MTPHNRGYAIKNRATLHKQPEFEGKQNSHFTAKKGKVKQTRNNFSLNQKTCRVFMAMGVQSGTLKVWKALSRSAPDQTTFIHTHKVVARCCAASDHPGA